MRGGFNVHGNLIKVSIPVCLPGGGGWREADDSYYTIFAKCVTCALYKCVELAFTALPLGYRWVVCVIHTSSHLFSAFPLPSHACVFVT